ncbi:unnamed protein product, partial [Oikopleura dioica]
TCQLAFVAPTFYAEKYERKNMKIKEVKICRKKTAKRTCPENRKKALQEAREDLTIAERKYHESKSKVEELELEITRLGSTNDALQQDLKLAFKRLSNLARKENSENILEFILINMIRSYGF